MGAIPWRSTRTCRVVRGDGEAGPAGGTGSAGQTVVEFAILLPVLLLLITGIMEFARLMQSTVTIQHAANEAARYAATGAGYTLSAGVRETQIMNVATAAATGLLVDGGAGPAAPGYFTVVIRSSNSGSGGGNNAGGPNELVRVEVYYNHPLLISFVMPDRTTIPLHAEALVLNERFARPTSVTGNLPSLPPR